MRVHVIGVAGTGMGALAGLLRELGHEVEGSDVSFEPPMGPALHEWGVVCKQGWRPAHLHPPPDCVVVGNVCRRDNPVVLEAERLGVPRWHIAEALRRFALAGTSPLVVTGTHGKTTTSTLAAYLLNAAGRSPGWLVGGLPLDLPRSFRRARPTLPLAGHASPRAVPFVIEGDEYDTAFWEKSAKFLHYGAEVATLGNLEHDHVDIYPTWESYRAAFERFVDELPAQGLLVANAADREVVRVVQRHARCEVAWASVGAAASEGVAPHWVAEPAASRPEGQTFDLFVGGVSAGRFALGLPGRHNLTNALLALAAVVQGYGVPVREAMRPLAEFRGVRRRQELLGGFGGVLLVDDFAHHPTAVRETLPALRARYPGRRLWAVFEPRSATACRRLHQEAYAGAFGAADRVVLAPLGRPDLPEAERLDRARLCADLERRGIPTLAPDTLEDMVAALVEAVAPGDVVALLSNGAFGGIAVTLPRALSDRARVSVRRNLP